MMTVLLQIALWITLYVTAGVTVGISLDKRGMTDTAVELIAHGENEEFKETLGKIVRIALIVLWPVTALSMIKHAMKR
jgi:hypothetical protein